MTFRHIGYGVLVAAAATAMIGWPSASDAKAKAMAPKPEPLRFCTGFEYKPVCTTLNGVRHTYGSACWAARDGARVIAQGACKPAMMHKAKMAKKMPKKMDKPAMKK